MNEKWLIVGLGNVGEEYCNTRHNTGFIVIDEILNRLEITASKQKFNGIIYEAVVNNANCLFVKPQTYMNNSGVCVSDIVNFFNIPLNKIIVLVDDTNFNVGKLKIKQNGSAGGHKGIDSIIEALNTEQFIRIKIGVNGKPNKTIDLKDWVVSTLSANEIEIIKSTAITILDIIKLIIDNNTQKAMSIYNNKGQNCR